MKIIYNIKKVRKQKGLTLRELAKMSGISHAYINEIENNKKHPTLIVLYQLANALEVDISLLYTLVSYSERDII